MHLPRRVCFKPSLWLGVLLASAHGLALFSVWWSPVPLPLSVALTIAVAVSCRVAMGRHVARFDRRSIASMTLLADGRLVVQEAGGEIGECTVCSDSTLFPWMIIVMTQVGGRNLLPRAIVILPDMLSADDWRAVRIWLKWRVARPAKVAQAPR